MPKLQHPEIIEVWERADQGHANAYRCGADDGHSYYVKSQGATWRGLACEWVAARLALEFGLPIAPFAQVLLDEGFAQCLQRDGNRHLVAGLAFYNQNSFWFWIGSIIRSFGIRPNGLQMT